MPVLNGRTAWIEAVARHLPLLLVLALLVRALLAVVLWFVFGQHEFTDDVAFHLSMASDPFHLFGCRQPQWSQQPPLLGLVETSLLPFATLLGPFFGVRLAYALWDLGGSVLLLQALRTRAWDTPVVRLLLLFGPLNVYASAVSAQDEVLTWFFVCACLSLWLRGRQGATFLIACAGVVVAKILFVPLALAIAPTLLDRRRWPWLLGGAGLLGGIYGWSVSCASPAKAYVLAAVHTINAWQWIVPASGMSWARALTLSAGAVLAFGLPALVWTMVQRDRTNAVLRLAWPEPILATVLGLLAFVGSFYHVVPEYVLALLPLLLLLLLREGTSSTTQVLVLVGAAIAPVVPDVLRFFVRFELGPAWLVPLHRIAATLVSLLCLGAMVWLSVRRTGVRPAVR